MDATLKPLCPTDLDALNAIAAAGAAGLTKEELLKALGNPSEKHAVRIFTRRVRTRSIPLQTLYIDHDGTVGVFRYVLAEGAVAGASATDAPQRSVTRIVTGDSGLGSTPGARVSVAWVRWLDGARAGDGCGEVRS